MDQPLQHSKTIVGELIEPPWSGDPKVSIRVVGDLMVFLKRFGLKLNIHDHFYPKNQCPLIDGISADVWWERYVGSTQGAGSEKDYRYDSVAEGIVLKRGEPRPLNEWEKAQERLEDALQKEIEQTDPIDFGLREPSPLPPELARLLGDWWDSRTEEERTYFLNMAAEILEGEW
jgi:hypothetical protein